MRRDTTDRPPTLRAMTLRLAPIALGVLAACTSVPDERPGAVRKETVFAVTESHALVSFNAGQPGKLLSKQPIDGLERGELVVGLDFRVARGQLYALTDRGRLLRIDTASGAASEIGEPVGLLLSTDIGFDFNPTVDRIRVITGGTRSMRLHPDTGAQVDGDPTMPGVQPDGALAYVAGDPGAGRTPKVVAAAYTYNKRDEKITTNYAIDAARDALVIQGSREGVTPAVSPNTGRLSTVGTLGLGPIDRAAFDIADPSTAAFVAVTRPGALRSDWYEIDLASGRASALGRIGGGEPVRGIAVEP